MYYGEPRRTAALRTRWTTFAALVAASAAVIGILDYRSSGASPSAAAPPVTAALTGPAGVADGVVPAGVTVFNTQFPAVIKLNPALLDALRRAAMDAAKEGITFYVNSGWRSAKYQEQLLQEAVAKYGSEQAAARWVASPSTSAHVSGSAVDLGRANATTWLSRYGARYGLCQIYRNESWHYELRPKAVSQRCPAMYADPTQDPRMQQ